MKTLRFEVDLDEPPIFPFRGATLITHTGGGMVPIEKRPDGTVHLNGNKLVLCRTDHHLDENLIPGYKLCVELGGELLFGSFQNASLLDFAVVKPVLWADEWKIPDDLGNTPRIFFCNTKFGDGKKRVFIRYGYWNIEEETVISSFSHHCCDPTCMNEKGN
jgi:hypothetical protein